MFGGQPSQPLSAEMQKLRAKQIDSLRQFFPTVKAITADIFEVPIQLPNRSFIKLVITLTPDFPKIPPILQISPPVQHPLVDPNMYITGAAHENLTRWTVHVSLGKTVYEIVQKFMKQPPTMGAPPPNPSLPASRPPSGISGMPNPIPSPQLSHSGYNPQTPMQPYPGNQPSMQSYPNNPQPAPLQSYPSNNTVIPEPRTQMAIPSSYPELDSKSANELQQLLNDEAEFSKFFENLGAVTTARRLRDDLRNANQELAEKIIAKEAEIERVKKEIEARSSAVKDKRNGFEIKLLRQQEVMKQFSTPALIEKLTEKAHEADEASEDLTRQFHNGGIDHKEFIKSYMEKRRLFHLRSAKKESLAMLAK